MVGHGWPHPESERARFEAYCKKGNTEMELWVEDVPQDKVKEQCEQFERLKAKSPTTA
jgi:hypothetical protein